jgi:hypothetical protein
MRISFDQATPVPIRKFLIHRGTLLRIDPSCSAIDRAPRLSCRVTSMVVSGKKEGVSVRYTVRDPLIADLLVIARQIFNNHLVGTQDLLRQLQREGRRG